MKAETSALVFVVAHKKIITAALSHPSPWARAMLATPGTEGQAAWLCGDRWPLLIMLARSSMLTSGHQLLAVYIK